MKIDKLLDKALNKVDLTTEQALFWYEESPVSQLAAVADKLRRESVPDPSVVTWQIDRNVNITNVCISGCRFCNFHCKPHQKEKSYVTTIEEYSQVVYKLD